MSAREGGLHWCDDAILLDIAHAGRLIYSSTHYLRRAKAASYRPSAER